jgi:alcohol dehydrogenase
MPHGLACSFTLPEIMLFNGKQHKNRVELIQGALGCGSLEAGVAAMHELLTQVGMPNYVRRYFPTGAQVQAFVGDFIAPGRAENNIAPVTQGDAVEIFRASATRMLAV